MAPFLKMTSWLIAALFVIHWFANMAASERIIGSRESCTNEGEEVSVDSIKDMSCFTCMCKNGFVECQRERCPSQAGCYMLMEEDREQCCQLCKGCLWEGQERASGSEWVDKEDPCRVFKCLAGVVTETKIICHVPCQLPQPPRPGECCPTCKGCLINGQEIGPERDATIPEDPCLNCHCHSSGNPHSLRSMTCTKVACPVLQCPLPKQYTPSGQCCPICKGTRLLLPPRNRCFLVQELRHEGEMFSSMVSNPSPSTVSSANEKASNPLGQVVVKKHDELSTGNCTKCTCMKNGTVHCLRETCPVLECPIERRVWPIELDARGNKRKSCCMKCMEEQAAATRQCSHLGKIYKEGERWALDPCRSCVCTSGSVRCAMEMCPPMNAILTSSKGPQRTSLSSPNIACPPNTRLFHPKGTCCPACVESDGVCSVFGDPHYRTFDGRFYSFQGACKYLLASDQCNGSSGTFSIRVTNDARDTFTSSWTKTISIKAYGHKVSLGQRMRVKVNGRRAILPLNLTSNSTQIISVKKEGGGVVLWLEIGIMVIWDGNSFLEVSVPTAYKKKLCGLCGNYNDDPKDDLHPREGFHFTDKGRQRGTYTRYGNNAPNHAKGNNFGSVAEFASSWRVGGKKACSRGVEEGMPWLPLDWVPSMCRSPSEMRRKRKRELYRKCRPLRSALFAACHQKVNPTIYVRSCLSDLCECPRGGMCHCPSMKAYAHACRRALQSTLPADPLGTSPFTLPREIENWRNSTGCIEVQGVLHVEWGRNRRRQQQRKRNRG